MPTEEGVYGLMAKKWTPNMVKQRLLEVLNEYPGAVSFSTLKNRMPTCEERQMRTQITNLIESDEIFMHGNHRVGFTYELNRGMSVNRVINSLWRDNPVTLTKR